MRKFTVIREAVFRIMAAVDRAFEGLTGQYRIRVDGKDMVVDSAGQPARLRTAACRAGFHGFRRRALSRTTGDGPEPGAAWAACVAAVPGHCVPDGQV
jgi:hypothetical protein